MLVERAFANLTYEALASAREPSDSELLMGIYAGITQVLRLK